MFNEYFDNVYLINLDRSKDRLENAKKELDKLNVDYERWSAIDGDITDFKWDSETNAKMPGWNKRSAGLVHTTIEIIRDAKRNNYSSILIFEDDIEFHPQCESIVPIAMKNLPQYWDLMFFAITNKHEKQWIGRHLKQVQSGWCCQAYAVHCKVYDWYLEELEKVNRPIDAITVEIQSNGKSYATETNMVLHPPNDSTIRGRFFDHSKEA
jgi:GR25 family glycosyltransferase involved in LPS biosynthesis